MITLLTWAIAAVAVVAAISSIHSAIQAAIRAWDATNITYLLCGEYDEYQRRMGNPPWYVRCFEWRT